jgi:hypothetical protein
MKLCQEDGCNYKVFSHGYCKIHQWKRTDVKYKANKQYKQRRIKPISDKRKKNNVTYSKKRSQFLSLPENKKCHICKEKPASQVHHKYGRIGKAFLDERTWMAVDGDCHRRIDEETGWALDNGCLAHDYELDYYLKTGELWKDYLDSI